MNERVRLTEWEIETIRSTVKRLFGKRARLILFGSRTDRQARGGDIDLMIETDERLPDRAALAIRLTSELQRQLGDQKIDVIVVDPDTPLQPIHRIARQTGVWL